MINFNIIPWRPLKQLAVFKNEQGGQGIIKLNLTLKFNEKLNLN